MSNEQVVCHCVGVAEGELKRAIQNGADDFSQLVAVTQACTQCGTCSLYLHELLGKKINWIAVDFFEINEVSKDIKSFKFSAKDKNYQFDSYQPGQYILLRGFIAGQWITRPYALAAKRSETGYREIIVRKKTAGVFTEWLFASEPHKRLQVSELQGTRYIDVAAQNKSFCFAGGVGITPVIAACRSIEQEDIVNPGLHIDYSVADLAHIICEQELNRIIEKYPFISMHIRVTHVISLQEIAHIVHSNDIETQFYIMGPNKFEEHVHKALLNCGVNADRINDLKDKRVPAKVDTVESPPPNTHRTYVYIGCLLLIAFLVQEGFDLKIAMLQQWQADEDYNRWSGIFLLSFFIFQWTYPLKQFFGSMGRLFVWQKIHKYNGVAAPVVLYIHSTTLGYAYLFVLSVAYLLNNALALCNRDIFYEQFKSKWVYKSWLSSHIILSFFVSILMWYHLFVAFAYS